MNFQEFLNDFGVNKKIKQEHVQDYLSSGGSQSKLDKFFNKAGDQGIKVTGNALAAAGLGGGSSKSSNSPSNLHGVSFGSSSSYSPYVNVGPPPPSSSSGGSSSGGSSSGSGGFNAQDYLSQTDIDVAAYKDMGAFDFKNQAALNAQQQASNELIAGLNADAQKYVADAYSGASMYGADRQLDIANVQSASQERWRKYLAEQQRESAKEVETIRGEYGLNMQKIVNAGLTDVAKIRGEFDLEGRKVTGEYALESDRIQGATARDVAERQKQASIFGGLVSAFNF